MGKLKVYFSVWGSIFSSLWQFKFGKKDTIYYASGWGLLKREIGLPLSSEKDWKVTLRVLKRVLESILFKPAVIGLVYTGGVLVSSEIEIPVRLGYLEYFDKKEKDSYSFYATQNLVFAELFFEKLFLCCLTLLLSAFIFPTSLFSNKKYTYSLLLEDSVMLYNLINCLENAKSKRLIHFNIYNRWSNLLGVVLKKYNIELVKVPSEVPLSMANSHIVTDTLVFCHPYQKEETEFLKESIHFKNSITWGPENIHKIAKFYQDKLPTKSKSIGFYSSGMWFRRKRGDIEVALGQTQNEDVLAGWLKEFVLENKEVEIQVYLHPNELKPENLEDSKEHWDNIFSGITINYINENTPSNLQFHKTKVGVSLFSTIMFERDYLGYSSIIVPIGLEGFPLLGTSFENKSAITKPEIIEILDSNLND